MQASKERCRTLEDELASIRQCLNESPLPKVRKTKDDILEFDNKSEFGDTIDGDSAQNSPEVNGLSLHVASHKLTIIIVVVIVIIHELMMFVS